MDGARSDDGSKESAPTATRTTHANGIERSNGNHFDMGNSNFITIACADRRTLKRLRNHDAASIEHVIGVTSWAFSKSPVTEQTLSVTESEFSTIVE
jgi:hypothetical protein